MNMRVKLEKAQDFVFALPEVTTRADHLSKTLKAVKGSFDAIKQAGYVLAKPIAASVGHLEVVIGVVDICTAFGLGKRIVYNDGSGRSLLRNRNETIALKCSTVSKLGKAIIGGAMTGAKLKIYVLPKITKIVFCRLPLINIAFHVASVADNIFAIIDSIMKIYKAQKTISDSKWEQQQLQAMFYLHITDTELQNVFNAYEEKIDKLKEQKRNGQFIDQNKLTRWENQRDAVWNQLNPLRVNRATDVSLNRITEYRKVCSEIARLEMDPAQASSVVDLNRQLEVHYDQANNSMFCQSQQCNISQHQAEGLRTKQLFVLAEAVAKLASTIIVVSLEVSAYTCPPLAVTATVLSAGANWTGAAAVVKDGYHALRATRPPRRLAPQTPGRVTFAPPPPQSAFAYSVSSAHFGTPMSPVYSFSHAQASA